MLKIGILDYGEINGVSDREKIAALLDLVVLVDEVGFSRYWLAEHYEEGAAWKNPETLLGILAGLTDRMKIGSAGVLLNVHNPLRVALNFRMLELLYPGRIDLGIARGRTNTETEPLLEGGFVANNYSLPYHDKADQLINYLRNEHIDVGRENKLILSPYLASLPDIWVLGSGNSSLSIAIKHGVSFCLSLFHNSSADHLRVC